MEAATSTLPRTFTDFNGLRVAVLISGSGALRNCSLATSYKPHQCSQSIQEAIYKP